MTSVVSHNGVGNWSVFLPLHEGGSKQAAMASARRGQRPSLLIFALVQLVLIGARTAETGRGEDIAQAESLRKEAEKLRLGKRYEDALKLFQEVLTLDPINPKAQWGVGRIFLEHAQPQDSLPFFRRAVELAHQSRGEHVTYQTGGAKASFKKARKRAGDPGNILQGSESSKVGQVFSEVISDVAMGIMLLDLGVCLGETAHFSEQIDAFTESLRLRPSNQVKILNACILLHVLYELMIALTFENFISHITYTFLPDVCQPSARAPVHVRLGALGRKHDENRSAALRRPTRSLSLSCDSQRNLGGSGCSAAGRNSQTSAV